jgi:hypothetical protein
VLCRVPRRAATLGAQAELNARVVIKAFLVGALLLTTPIGFIVLKQNPYFDQTR